MQNFSPVWPQSSSDKVSLLSLSNISTWYLTLHRNSKHSRNRKLFHQCQWTTHYKWLHNYALILIKSLVSGFVSIVSFVMGWSFFTNLASMWINNTIVIKRLLIVRCYIWFRIPLWMRLILCSYLTGDLLQCDILHRIYTCSLLQSFPNGELICCLLHFFAYKDLYYTIKILDVMLYLLCCIAILCFHKTCAFFHVQNPFKVQLGFLLFIIFCILVCNIPTLYCHILLPFCNILHWSFYVCV